MINLLPPEEKEILAQEENYKLVLILGILISLFLISLSLILFSVKTYISGQVKSQEILASLEEEEFRSSGVQNLEGKLNLINQNLFKINSFYRAIPGWTELLEKISGTIPGEIYLTNFSLDPTSSVKTSAGNEFQASLAGFSPTREVLLEFKKRLEAEPNFEEIYFPPSNWVKPKDIDFSTTFKVISK